MTTKKTAIDLAHVLSSLAFHVSTIMTERPTREDAPYSTRARVGFYMGGYAEGCPFVRLEVVITPVSAETWGDAWGVWATVHTRPGRDYATSEERNAEPNVFDGTWTSHGNRCGGREYLVSVFAPIVEWVAKNGPISVPLTSDSDVAGARRRNLDLRG
jgi:hypothetical protein